MKQYADIYSLQNYSFAVNKYLHTVSICWIFIHIEPTSVCDIDFFESSKGWERGHATPRHATPRHVVQFLLISRF